MGSKIAFRSLLVVMLGACGSDPSTPADASIDAANDAGACGPMPTNSTGPSWPLCRSECSYICGQQCNDICTSGGCWTCADGGWLGATYDCQRDCGAD